MADTTTTGIGLTKPEIGASDNTWGTKINDDLDILDALLTGVSAIASTGGDTALTSTQHRTHRLRVTGILVSNATITFDGRGGRWVIENATTGAFTLTARIGALAGTEIPQGENRLVYYNGTDMDEVGGVSLGAALNAIDALTPAADRMAYFTSASVAALATITTAGRALLDDASADAQLTTLGLTANGKSLVTAADYAAQRVLLGLVIGTNVQAYDAELAALAGLTSAADKLPYFTGSGTAALADLTAAGRALLDDAAATNQLTTLGLSTNGKSLVTAASYAAMRTLLDLEPGIDFYSVTAAAAAFQPLDSDLTAIAALTTTSTGRSLLAIADAAAGRTILSLGTIATQASSSVSITGGSITGITDLAVADGGTGASSAANARTNLGLVIGTNVLGVPTSGTLPVGWSGFVNYVSNTALANNDSCNGSDVKTAVAHGSGFSHDSGTVQTGTWINESGVTLDGNGIEQFGHMRRTA